MSCPRLLFHFLQISIPHHKIVLLFYDSVAGRWHLPPYTAKAWASEKLIYNIQTKSWIFQKNTVVCGCFIMMTMKQFHRQWDMKKNLHYLLIYFRSTFNCISVLFDNFPLEFSIRCACRDAWGFQNEPHEYSFIN